MRASSALPQLRWTLLLDPDFFNGLLGSAATLSMTPSKEPDMTQPHAPGTTRRSLIQATSRAAAAAVLAASVPSSVFAMAGPQQESDRKARPESGKLLMLGGTRFLGPEIVREALASGWQVTLFNRGKSNPDLFKDLDLRVGDRNTGDYSELAKGEWDLVIDTSCYIPGHVSAAIEALKGRIGHYVVVSTISVYAGSDTATVVDESAPVGKVEPERRSEFKVIDDVGKFGSKYYGALKALCEQAAEEALPGKVTVVRPGLIVGPDDGSDRFTYWPVRVAEGGEVLAPGDPEGTVQYVDVRDLGDFTFDVGARRVGKVMNAVGFEGSVTMKDMLMSCVPTEPLEGAEPATFTWVSDEFLIANEVAQWMGLPLWIAGGRSVYSNRLAIEEGHKFRDLKDTAAATVTWHKQARQVDHKWLAGISREKERQVLDAWAAR